MGLVAKAVGLIAKGTFQTTGLGVIIGCVVIGSFLLFKSDKKPVNLPQDHGAPAPPPPPAPVAPPPQVSGYGTQESVVRVIVEESNEPADVRIRKLSNLRYERLITDEEFQAAKAKILGI